jgi:putative ABC transport system permease protein
VKAGSISDSFVSGGTANDLFARLQKQPDAVLLSAETVKDFQLSPGDHVTLRLQDGRTRQYKPVTFTYVGVAKEFPTAPSDSFIVANADYVAQATGDAGVGSFLVQTSASPPSVAAELQHRLGAAAHITDITNARRLVGSSLTAVSLSGLTRVELAFAAMLVASAAALLLVLGLAERRRTFAIASALGARRRALGGFVWSEAVFVCAVGAILGGLGGTILSYVLVKELTGVFDPPPDVLAVPWGYLLVTGVLAIAAVAIAAVGTLRRLDRPTPELLREL